MVATTKEHYKNLMREEGRLLDEAANLPQCVAGHTESACCVADECVFGADCAFQLRTKLHHLSMMTALHFDHELHAARQFGLEAHFSEHLEKHAAIRAEIASIVVAFQQRGACFETIGDLRTFVNALGDHMRLVDAKLYQILDVKHPTSVA